MIFFIGIVLIFTVLSIVLHDNPTESYIICDSKDESNNGQCVPNPEQYCVDWCDVEELYDFGCDPPTLNFINRTTNLFDETFDGTYYLDWIGLPDSISEERFEWCLDFIYEKRISSSSESLNKKWGELYLEYQLLKKFFSDNPNNMTAIERMAEIDDETMHIVTILSERGFTIEVPGRNNGNAISDDQKYDALNSKGCPQFCSKKVADNVFSFCGGDGFYSEGYMFTNNSTHYFDHNECKWTDIQ